MNDRPIVITGFMASGKTVVAEALGGVLGSASVDLDGEITRREGDTPAEIICGKGEEAFRAIETRTLQRVLEENSAVVIALGGGAWMIAGNRALLERYQSLSVWLDAPFELCWKRILNAGSKRPLAPDKETARSLFAQRLPSYERATLRIPIVEDDKVGEIASRIAAALESC